MAIMVNMGNAALRIRSQMKRIAVICLSVILALCLLPGCFPEEQLNPPEGAAPSPVVDWSQVDLPDVGQEGDWVLTEEAAFMLGAMFSPDGETIYGYGSNTYLILMKSVDGGHSWSILPGLQQLEEQYDVWEVLFAKTVGKHLFLCSTGWGIFHSTDGGQTFDRLPPIPGIEGKAWESQEFLAWRFDVTIDDSGRPIILMGTVGRDEEYFGGLWMLSYPYENWVDMRVGNTDSGSMYNVWAVAFSPNYVDDRQIIALISDWEHLWVTFRCGEEAWGESVGNTQIPDVDTVCDFDKALSNMAFPDDYDSQYPTVFVGAGLYTEHFYRTPEYADLYRIDGKPVESGLSTATDLDVGGKGTSTPVYSIVVNGPANTGTILAGSVGQVYRSTDGGKSWQMAEKPPTGGAIMWLGFEPSVDENPVIYCTSSDPGMCMVPRGFDVKCEHAFSRSVDGGITWNQVSMIGTTVDEIVSYASSPDYDNDQTIFMLSRSRHLLIASFDKDQSLRITREPNEPGVTARVFICPHQANPPQEEMRIAGEEWVTGTGPTLELDDKCPSVAVEVPPLSEQTYLGPVFEFINENYEWVVDNHPYWLEQWDIVDAQPRQAQIYVLEGSVTVTIGERTEYQISVDGDPADWHGIGPLITDPEEDAPSRDSDMKALYVTNDDEYLYFMFESYAQETRSHCEILIDMDLDGKADHTIFIWTPDEPDGPATNVKPLPDAPAPWVVSADIAAFSEVAEARIPLKDISVERFRITRIDIMDRWMPQAPLLDSWKGSVEVIVKSSGTSVSPPASDPIPFPSTESLWKTTDGGNSWERILTSGLKLRLDGEDIQVGLLESISLSDNFARDNTLFVYEGADKPNVWVSTDGGATFSLQK
jgi:hypothetical protein